MKGVWAGLRPDAARQSGATPHFHFGFGLSEIIHQHSCLISQSRQSKQSWHVEQSLHATAPPHAPDDPDNRHTTHNGRLSRTIGHRAANNSPHRWGGRQNPTHTGAAQTPYTSALARCGRRSPLGPISPFQRRRAATRRAEPVSAGDLGAARDAGMRDGSVGSVPKADRLGCELGSHRFCTRSITCRPSEAALDGPGPAAVKASVDEGMSSREPSSSATGAPVQLSEFEIAVDLESSAR